MQGFAGAPAQAQLRPTCAVVPLALSPKLALMLGMAVCRIFAWCFSSASRRVAANQFRPIRISPSVTSVASVRCFPREVCSSPASRRVAPNQFRPNRISPLCDLRGLCAMLSPRGVSPTSGRVAANQFRPIRISPSVTSMASVRCFPRDVCFSPAAAASPLPVLPDPNFPPL